MAHASLGKPPTMSEPRRGTSLTWIDLSWRNIASCGPKLNCLVATACFDDSPTLSAGPRSRLLYRLLCNDEEELEMAKFVHALIAAATIADLHGGALRQP